MIAYFSFRWQTSICLNVLFEAFMDCMGNLWSSPKKMYFLTEHTQLTKQETMFPCLQPSSSYGQILLCLFSFGQQMGKHFQCEVWNGMSEMMCCLQLLQHSIFILRQDFIQYCKVLDCGKRETGLGEAVRIVSL